MAYTQDPGRGNNSKTGSGLPGVLLQTRTGLTPKEAQDIEGVTKLNKFRNVIEAGAKTDSIAAAGARKLSGGNEFQQGLQGNLAANRARVAGGASDMTVMRGKSVESGASLSSGTTSYTRNKPVEKEHKRIKASEKYNIIK
jgi:hypothetical protein